MHIIIDSTSNKDKLWKNTQEMWDSGTWWVGQGKVHHFMTYKLCEHFAYFEVKYIK